MAYPMTVFGPLYDLFSMISEALAAERRQARRRMVRQERTRAESRKKQEAACTSC
jgi:hypothetical protein